MDEKAIQQLLANPLVAELNRTEFRGQLYNGTGFVKAGQIFYEAAIPGIVREKRVSNYPAFVKEVDKRREILWKLEEEFLGSPLAEHYGTPGDFYLREMGELYVSRFMEHTEDLSFEQQVKSFRLTNKLGSKFVKIHPERLGNYEGKEYSMRFRAAVHPEAPIALCIFENNELICTVGGLIVKDGNKISLRITNQQGGKNQEVSQKQLENLAKVTKSNWRLFLTKKITGFSEKFGLPIEGHKPKVLMGFHTTPSQLKRAARMYEQTYRKSGFERPAKKGEAWKFRPK